MPQVNNISIPLFAKLCLCVQAGTVIVATIGYLAAEML